MSSDVALEDRLRATYRAVTTSTPYSPPPPIETVARPNREPRRPRRLLLVVGAFAAILAIVVAVVAISTSDDGGRLRKVVPPSEQPLFPDVVNHTGPELLLSPQQIPDGYHLLLATGPDTGPQGGGGSIGGPEITRYWVRLDATGTQPESAFSIAWGPADLSKSEPQLRGLPTPQGDALDPYRTGTPITINGHQAYWSPSLGIVAWEQNDQVVLVVALTTDSWTGNWPTHLAQPEVEAIAERVERNGDGSYGLTDPPAGYRLVGQERNFASAGTNQRHLVYTDDNGHGFGIQLVDNTDSPPGITLSWPTTRLVKIRDQNAVLTPFLRGGDGSGCSSEDSFLCTMEKPGTLAYTYLQWLEPDSTRVTITAYGLTDQQVLDIGRSLTPISEAEWKKLTGGS